jgi:hypothetical protein
MDQTVLVQTEPLYMWQLVEIPVNSDGLQKIQLPDVQQLRSMIGLDTVIIKGMYLVTPKVLGFGVNTPGTNAPLTELRKMTLTVFSEGWQRGQIVPLLFLNSMADADAATATTIPYSNTPFELADWRKVDFPQSFIQFCNTQVSAGAPYVVMIWVKYIKQNQDGEILVRGS